MNPKTKMLARGTAEVALGTASTLLAEVIGVAIGIAVLEGIEKLKARRQAKKDWRALVAKHDGEMPSEPPASMEKIIPRAYRQTGGDYSTPETVRPFLESQGPFGDHAIFIHEDTQPLNKTGGDGCAFSVWTWSEEIKVRESANVGTYYLTEDEYKEDEFDFEQILCEYYVDDNRLIDEDGVEFPYIPNAGFEDVGELVSAPWGKGARRSDTIYLRNEAAQREFMIVREFGLPSDVHLAFGERDGDNVIDLDGHRDYKAG